MVGFTIFDLVAAGIVILSAYFAYIRGFVRETMSIAGWVVALIAAYLFAPAVVPLVGEIPVIGSILRGSCELAVIAAFALVFTVALILASLVTSMSIKISKLPVVEAINNGLGVLFGILRGALLIAVVLIVNDAVLPSAQTIDVISDSQSAMLIGDLQKLLQNQLSDGVPGWISTSYGTFMAVCETDDSGVFALLLPADQ